MKPTTRGSSRSKTGTKSKATDRAARTGSSRPAATTSRGTKSGRAPSAGATGGASPPARTPIAPTKPAPTRRSAIRPPARVANPAAAAGRGGAARADASARFPSRRVWEDRFAEPTPDELVAALGGEVAAVLGRARRMLVDAGLGRELVAWRGECWRWTIDYRLPRSTEATAILVPSPEHPQLAMPVDEHFLARLPYRRLKKVVREGLELAGSAFDTNLAVWLLAGPDVVDDLSDLIRRRVRDAMPASRVG